MLVFVDSDINEITSRKEVVGINPIDQFSAGQYQLTTREQTDSKRLSITNEDIARSFDNHHLRRPRTQYAPSDIIALTGMYDKTSSQSGYCVGLSKVGEYDGVQWSSARLWIGSFSAPEFQVSRINSKSEIVVVKNENPDTTTLREDWAGDTI